MTLRTRLTAAFLLLVLVPLLVAGVLVFALLPREVARLQAENLTSSAALAVSSIEERCARVVSAAAAAARAAGQPGAALGPALTRLVEVEAVSGVQVLDAAGRLRAGAGSEPAQQAPQCTAGAVARTPTGGQLVVTQQLRSADGEPAGSVVAALDLDDAWVRGLGARAGRADVVLFADGEPVAASATVAPALVRAALSELGRLVERDGQVAVAVPSAPGSSSGALVAQAARLDLRTAQMLYPLLVVGAGVLAAVIGAGLARATTRPLEELGSAASRVAGGDLATTIPVRSRDEVGRLAQSFNVMTEELRVHVEALERSGQQLRAGVGRLGDALSGTHDLDRILAVVLETARATTGARSGAVLMGGAVADELVLSVGHELAARGVPEGLRVPVGVGLSGEVARTRAPLRGRSGTDPGERAPAPGEPAGVPFVALPLMSSGQVVGVLLLWDRAGDADFTEDDLALLKTFTSQATVAVDNVLLHEEARRLSVTDAMTGLTNYRGFTVTVGKEIERAARFGRPLALLLLDLDHFKLVNDVWGHQRGDAVLVELAARVRAQVRDVDTCARYGGEEFVVVLPETGPAGAVQAAERILAAVRRRPFGDADETSLDVTVSIGVAVFPDHGTTATTLLRRADEALYAAKAAGRDGWQVAPAETPPPQAPPARTLPDVAAEPGLRSS